MSRLGEGLVVTSLAGGMLLGAVAFFSAVLSPLVAAFVAGLGIGGSGVLAVMRLAPRGRRET